MEIGSKPKGEVAKKEPSVGFALTTTEKNMPATRCSILVYIFFCGHSHSKTDIQLFFQVADFSQYLEMKGGRREALTKYIHR